MNTHLLKIVTSLVLFFSGLSQSYALPQVIVYTGTLDHDRLQKKQLVRAYIIPTVKPGANPGSTSTSYSVIVTLHFGSFDHPEYIGMQYDNASYDTAAKELLLLRNDDGRGRKLPIIKLHWEPGIETISGEYLSQSEHQIGTMNLTKGFELNDATIEDNNILQPLGGVYKAYCSADDNSGLKLTEFSLLPSRLLQDRTVAESPLNTLNYIGGGLCDYRGSRAPFTDWACEGTTGATYNFYQGDVTIWQGTTTVRCKRGHNNELVCNGPRYRNCKLTLKESNVLPAVSSSLSTHWNPNDIPVVPAIEDVKDQSKPNTQVKTTDPSCSTWNGNYHGILKHRLTGRDQVISVDLQTITSSGTGANAKCLLVGDAQLYFGNDETTKERLVYGFQNAEFLAESKVLTLRSETYTDLVLHLEKGSAPDQIVGHWYAGLVGHVGVFSASKTAHPVISKIIGIPSVSGFFQLHDHPSTYFNIQTNNVGFDKHSHDPFHQLAIGGWRDFIVQGQDGLNGPVRDPIAGGSYDFYTNYIALRLNNAFYTGQIHHDRLELECVQRRNNTQSRPLEWHYRYDRVTERRE